MHFSLIIRTDVNRSYRSRLCLIGMVLNVLVSPEFSSRTDAKHIESIKVLSLGNEFREVMAARVNQEKFRKGIA